MIRSLRLLPLLALAACTVGPEYARPAALVPQAYKAAEGWSVAAPADHLDRGDWWALFGDAALDGLAQELDRANQTLAQARANYDQARAVTREVRASLFPVIDVNANAQRQGQGGTSRTVTDPNTGQLITVSGGQRTTRLQLGAGASWAPDLFGRIGRGVEQARANAQGAEADLASARLALHAELALNYLSLRAADAEILLVEQTVVGFERALAIASNRYTVGVAPRTDQFEAQAQLASTRSTLEGLRRTRRTFENAIAVLVGKPAGDFVLAPAQWQPRVPGLPASVPSTLLERRPDIASAERAAAAANATIGVEQAAFFPQIALSADGGLNAQSLGSLFASSATVWSLGAQLAQTVFDFGARSARVAQARAGYEAAVAGYRQTTLVAFQEVEDQLIAGAALARQEALLRDASAAANRTEASFLDRYRAGLIPYTDVVQVQATALNARRALLQATADRQTAAVALIQALGGGWTVDELAAR